MPLSVLFLTLLLVPAVALAQAGGDAPAAPAPAEGSPVQLASVSAGLGAGSAGGYEESIVNWSAGATLATRRYLFSARVLRADEFDVLGPTPRNTFTEVGLLGGVHRSFAGQRFLARAQVGVGVVLDRERRCGDAALRGGSCPANGRRARDAALGVGVPAELELVATPFRYVGLGVRAAGHANAARSFAGLSVALHVGRLY